MSRVFQDWEPVVLTKKPDIKNKTLYNIINTKKNENEITVPKIIGKEYGLKVQQHRNAKKLTQKELATKLNILFEQIRDIENGTAVKNGILITKINRYLQITNK